MNKEELFECLSGLSKTNNLRDGIDIRKEEANIIVEEIERLNNVINELEKDLIKYFKKEYPDRKLEDYNLENCTYDYALVILGRLQELKGEDKE